MPINGFTVGRDVSLVVHDSEGPHRFSLITNFTSKPVTSDVKVKGLDGLTRHVVFHDGWQGQLDIERQDGELDDFWAKIENDYHEGVDRLPATISETITEPGGGTSQFRYTEVLFKLEDAGEKKGDATVKQKLSWLAQRRIKI